MSKEKDNKELGEELIKGIFNTIRQPALLMIEENKEQNNFEGLTKSQFLTLLSTIESIFLNPEGYDDIKEGKK